MVGVSASVNLPLHHKVQKFSYGTGSPGWSRKKGRKTVVVVVVVVVSAQVCLHGPADASATPSSLAPVKSRMVYLSGAGLPRLSWKKD